MPVVALSPPSSCPTLPALPAVLLLLHRDAVYCESHMAPLLDELKYNINLRMHYIGSKQVCLTCSRCLQAFDCGSSKPKTQMQMACSC